MQQEVQLMSIICISTFVQASSTGRIRENINLVEVIENVCSVTQVGIYSEI